LEVYFEGAYVALDYWGVPLGVLFYGFQEDFVPGEMFTVLLFLVLEGAG
jgi:hypothetical protein